MGYLRFEIPPDNLSLKHYGIKGMHWGVWNDETRKRRLGLDNGSGGSHPDIPKPVGRKTPKLSNSQKKALKTAAAVGAGAAVLGIGIYAVKNGYLSSGKEAVDKVLSKNVSKVVATTKNGTVVHSIKETHADTLRKANPTNCQKNCPVTSTVGVLRESFGIDCEARYFDSPPEGLDMVRECFTGATTIPRGIGDSARATAFGKSPKAAGDMLKKRFGDNASGIVGFEWRKSSQTKDDATGHFITFKIIDGAVSFFDCQNGREIDDPSKYWMRINSEGMLQAARLDNAQPNFDALEKYVKFN